MPKRHFRVDPPTDATAEQLRAWNDLNRQLTELTDALHNIKIESGGTFEYADPHSVYEDLRVPFEGVGTAGVADPGYDAFVAATAGGTSGTYAYAFAAAAKESLFFSVQMPHNYKEGTDIQPHVHWSPTDGTTGNVKWSLIYTWANIGDPFPSLSTISVLATAGGTADTHQFKSLGSIDGTNKKISSMMMCHVYRDGADGNDTYAADAVLLEFDMHYEVDTLGSKTYTEKR